MLASGWRVDRPRRSFLCSFITQDSAVNRNPRQRPRNERASVPSPARPSADSRRASGGSPRSVHPCGSVIWPLTPPEQTNTVSAPRRFTYRTSSRCPFSGWNGWVTITKPEGSLDDAALCRFRGYPESPYAASAFRYFHRPDRRWKVASRREPVPELIQVVLLILRELRQRLPVHTGRSLVGLDLLVCVPHQSLRDIERLAC